MSFLTKIRNFSVAFEEINFGIVDKEIHNKVINELELASNKIESKIKTCLCALDQLPEGILSEETKNELKDKLIDEIKTNERETQNTGENFWTKFSLNSKFILPDELKERIMNALDKTGMLTVNKYQAEELFEKFWYEVSNCQYDFTP
jgi:hypothetical protein